MWLAVGIVATLMVGLPGLPGRLAAGISTALLPAVIRRAVASAAGVGVMLAPIAADARTPDPGTHTTVTVCPLPTPAATAATPALPTTPTTPVPPTTLPAPMWPLSASPSGLAGNSTSNSASNPATGSIHVNVNPGDSLWEIAAERLGPTASSADVARAWRRIYALNHDVIGGDPSSIRPGQSLSVPTDPKEYR
jgi:nucleoid-associated protein YgaU